MSPARYLLVDADEGHLIAGILADATSQHPEHCATWRNAWTDLSGAIVHGTAEGGRLMALPADLAPRRWMVEQLRALAATADRTGRVQGWARRGAVEALARRIPADHPEGPRAIRVEVNDLRVLLDAAEGAAGRSPQDETDRAWLDAIAAAVNRIGGHLAACWTEGPDQG